MNPQTGNITLSFGDVELPGRAGHNFTFGRTWTLNQSNVFAMERSSIDGSNLLTSNTIERYNHMGVGWNTSTPYIFTDAASSVKSLFLGGSVFELNSTTLPVYNTDNSNILGYDLKDLRVYAGTAGSEISYQDFNSGVIPSGYAITDLATDRSEYVLILKDNSKYYFRPDGLLMLHQDKTGLNRIWYFYNEYATGKHRLVLAVDAIGREIAFAYDSYGNLESLSWQVTTGKKQVDGTRTYAAEARSVHYAYADAEQSYPDIAACAAYVVNKNTPYALVTVTDAAGYTTKFDYQTGLARYSFNSAAASHTNVYLMLTSITDKYRTAGFRNKRCFEYAVPADGLYTHQFYAGYMEYYKVSREYQQDRHARIMHDTSYIYHKPGVNGNFNRYSTVIRRGGLTSSYVYSLSSYKNQDNVLDTLTLESSDGFLQMTDFVYTNERTKKLAEVFRKGQWIYSEKYEYDLKGNLKRFEDKQGLVVTRQYDNTYSVPVEEVKTVRVEGAAKNYKVTNAIDTLGRITEQWQYLEQGGSVVPIRIALLSYDPYGNVITQTDANNNVIHTEYDAVFHAFPVKTWQTVTIAKWSAGTLADNWMTDPDATELVQIRNWKVFNTDGSVWMEVDNEGYAVEHYYDNYGTETDAVNPDNDDLHNFATSNNYTDIYAEYLQANFSAYFSYRMNNPGMHMDIDYENDLVKSFVDVDKGNSIVKSTGKQGNGLGNVEEEIEYGTGGSVYAAKRMTYDALGRMVALTDPDAGTGYTEMTVHETPVQRYDKTWLVTYDDLGRQKRVIYPETTPGKIDMKEITYDDLLNTVKTRDPEGRTIIEKMDWNGNLVKLTHLGDSATPVSEQQVYTYVYDELNRKIRFSDAQGIVTTYSYDERDLLVKQDYGNGYDAMEYNALGQLIKKSDRKLQVTAFVYDEMGRNTRVAHYAEEADFPGNILYTVDTVYDFRGNAVRINNQNLIEYYVYDFGNRVTRLERYVKDNTARTGAGTLLGLKYSKATSDSLGADWLTDNSAAWQTNAFTGCTLQVGDETDSYHW